MEQIMAFYAQYGWQLALIALIGIIILGVLKYANVFVKIEKEKRKPIYFAISLGFSIVATIIYLLIIKQFTFEYVISVSLAIYALNQSMYAVYENTNLRDLMKKISEKIVQKVLENLFKNKTKNKK